VRIGRGRDRSVQAARPDRRTRHLVALGLIASVGGRDLAQAADLDAEAPDAASTLPNVYLDLRTTYSRAPAGTLSFGFSNPSLSSAIAAFQTLAAAAGSAPLARPSSPSQGVALDVPLTMDFNDRLTVYGGFSAGASQGALSDWSSFAVTSWSVGFQADLYKQNGGSIPTVTLQSTRTPSVPDSPLATTSLNTIVELDYALNADETKRAARGRAGHKGCGRFAAGRDQSQCRRLCRHLLSGGR
jgi:hypothetical protein